MGEAGAIKAAQDGRELLEEDALEVDVFLVGADYVWGSGEWIVILGRLGEGAVTDIRSIFFRRLCAGHCCRAEYEASIEAGLLLMGTQLFEPLRRRKYLGTRSTAPLRDTHGSSLGRQGPS